LRLAARRRSWANLLIGLAANRSEGTLSIHSVTTRRREGHYWATVFATLALGRVGDFAVPEAVPALEPNP
jgi:uncharacterized membrane-anchored protein